MGYAQQSIRVSGYIKDASSGELLIGASIQVMGTAVQVSSNTYGYFAINVPDGAKRLAIGYVGYGDLIVDLDSENPH